MHVGEQHQGNETDEQNGGADFSCHQSPREHPAFPKVDNAHDHLEDFFDYEQAQHRTQDGIFQGQTKRQGELGDLICQRVQNLAQVGDHIVAPGDLPVHHIRDAGDCHNGACNEVLIILCGIQVDIGIYGDQHQPKQAEQIRYGEYFLFPVFDEHGNSLR